MARLASAGQTYQAVAEQTGVSFWTARKWIRRAKQADLAGLIAPLGRPSHGPMAELDELVRYVGLRWKRQHPTWGAVYMVKKMSEQARLKKKVLPSPVTLWRYWRSFGERLFAPRRPAEPKLPPAGVAHGVWQLDAKESVVVPGVGVVTFNQARDEFGRARVMHQVHPAATPAQKVVKLTRAQVQQDCRLAFTEWGRPDAIQTDRASVYVDADPTRFPTELSLWWVGLGIEHRLIPAHTPQRNGSVERSHRTLDERTLVGQDFAGAAHLQAQVEADWHELNAECPSRAKGCHGRPPLLAHPELLSPRRPYRPEWELDLFDLSRVDAYLTGPTWLRRVSSGGQVNLGSYPYGLGKAWAGQAVSIQFEPAHRQFVFTQIRPATKAGQRLPELTPVRRTAQGLSVAALTGLPAALSDLPPRQLMFPLLMCAPSALAQGV
jgi:transposase InsO family protein